MEIYAAKNPKQNTILKKENETYLYFECKNKTLRSYPITLFWNTTILSLIVIPIYIDIFSTYTPLY